MTRKLSILGAVSLMAGCASQTQLLDARQGMAIQTAVSRGQFDLNCPSAKGVLISREVVEPAFVGPYVGGIPRNEYTVGVEGCGKRNTYVVICPQGGTGCFAAGPGNFIRGG
jgi:hypothetical protein